MTDETPPAPSSCVHNLHRHPDRDGDALEPTRLCRNDVGAFHMMDCPLEFAFPCTYFEPAPEEREAVTDAEIEAAGRVLRRDFMSWRYTQRVRALRNERGWLAERTVVEQIAEPDEEQELVLRLPPEAPEGQSTEGQSTEGEATEGEAATEPAPGEPASEDDEPLPAVHGEADEEEAVQSGPELYPGQRRSEDQRKPRPAAKPAAVVEAPDDEQEDAPPVKRTVEELLDTLPEAHLPERRPPAKRGRRRRGRRGGGRSDAGRGGGGQGESKSGGGARGSGRGGRSRGGGRKPGKGRASSPGKPSANPAGKPSGSEAAAAGEARPKRRRRRRRPRRGGKGDGTGGGPGRGPAGGSAGGTD